MEEVCRLMLEDERFVDLEDTLQYLLAKKENCDLIISNDEEFVSKDIPHISSKEFCMKFLSD